MWGREWRAGLVFVLVSLAAGSLFREWKRAHETSFADLVADLESRDADRARMDDPRSAADSTATGGSASAHAAGPRGARRPSASGRAGAPALVPGAIDVDRASAAELERLPGIGPALAARIVADREGRGRFGDPAALLRVPGIGPRTLARIRPYLAPPAQADSGSPIAK